MPNMNTGTADEAVGALRARKRFAVDEKRFPEVPVANRNIFLGAIKRVAESAKGSDRS